MRETLPETVLNDPKVAEFWNEHCSKLDAALLVAEKMTQSPYRELYN
jgi:hypothetical protein